MTIFNENFRRFVNDEDQLKQLRDRWEGSSTVISEIINSDSKNGFTNFLVVVRDEEITKFDNYSKRWNCIRYYVAGFAGVYRRRNLL